MASSLSVIIITKNAASQIKTCLESVLFADEIIVLDSGSTDDTVSICQKYTDKVFITDWPGYGVQKNRAIEKATCDWILSLDADEHLTPELARSIQETIHQAHPNDAYSMRRRTSLCGQYIKHGEWANDWCVRLFQRGKATFTEVAVHEHLACKGNIGRLKGDLLHDSYPDIDGLLQKINHYSTLKAQILHQQGKHASISTPILHGVWRFIRSYIIRLGFLDGFAGFIVAYSAAASSFICRSKLLFLSREAQPQKDV